MYRKFVNNPGQRGRGKFSGRNVKYWGLLSITKKYISKQRVGQGRCERDYLFETDVPRQNQRYCLNNKALWCFCVRDVVMYLLILYLTSSIICAIL